MWALKQISVASVSKHASWISCGFQSAPFKIYYKEVDMQPIFFKRLLLSEYYFENSSWPSTTNKLMYNVSFYSQYLQIISTSWANCPKFVHPIKNHEFWNN